MYQLTNDESKQESNLQVSQDTLKQADDMPAFGIWAQAIPIICFISHRQIRYITRWYTICIFTQLSKQRLKNVESMLIQEKDITSYKLLLIEQDRRVLVS